MSAGREDPAASPCIGICRMSDSAQLCEGCWRTLAEIAEWGQAGERRRLEILHAVAERRDAAGSPGPLAVSGDKARR